jgi:hypothetical protein
MPNLNGATVTADNVLKCSYFMHLIFVLLGIYFVLS